MKCMQLLLIYLLLLSCQFSKQERVGYRSYAIGSRVDSTWIVQNHDVERSWKYHKNRIDSNLVCRSIADTITCLMKFNLDSNELDSLKRIFTTSLSCNYDSVYRKKSVGYYESHELVWLDYQNHDVVRFIKTKMNSEFGKWSLEISNDTLLEKLSSLYDPYYYVPIPTKNNMRY